MRRTETNVAHSSDSHRPMSARELLTALSPAKNHINVIRGTVNYMVRPGDGAGGGGGGAELNRVAGGGEGEEGSMGKRASMHHSVHACLWMLLRLLTYTGTLCTVLRICLSCALCFVRHLASDEEWKRNGFR